MTKRWRAVPGWEGIYSVSDAGDETACTGGRFRSFVLPGSCAQRHPRRKHARGAHVLVALAFIGPRPEGLHVNHIDGDKLNNAVSNLEYCTPKENTAHAFRAGLIPSRVGTRGKLKIEGVRKIRAAIEHGEDRNEIAARRGVSRQAIDRIASGECWGGGL